MLLKSAKKFEKVKGLVYSFKIAFKNFYIEKM